MNNATVAPVSLPYRLTFDGPTPTGGLPKVKPGRGNAGWTVATFASIDDARAFMAAHPGAEMPCWRRF